METKKRRKRSAKNNEDDGVSKKITKTANDDVDMKLGWFKVSEFIKFRFISMKIVTHVLLNHPQRFG